MTIDEYSKAQKALSEIAQYESLTEKVMHSKANNTDISIILNRGDEKREVLFTTNLSSPLGNYIYEHILNYLEKTLNKSKDIFDSL